MIQVLEWSKEKPYNILVGKFKCVQILFLDPLQNQEIPLKEVPRNLSDLDKDINMDSEENSPYQEGVISETYQRPDKSYLQEPQE